MHALKINFNFMHAQIMPCMHMRKPLYTCVRLRVYKILNSRIVNDLDILVYIVYIKLISIHNCILRKACIHLLHKTDKHKEIYSRKGWVPRST